MCLRLVIFLFALTYLNVKTASSSDGPIERSSEILFRNSKHVAVFDLGELPSGQLQKLSLKLKNNSADEFSIHKFQTTCGCVKAELKDSVIPSFGDATLSVELNTEKSDRARESKITAVLYLFYSELDAIEVRVNYTPAGVLSFGAVNTSLAKISEHATTAEFEIPILITDPVLPENIVVTGGGALKNLTGKVVRKGGAFQVSCKLVLDQPLKASVTDFVKVSEYKTGVTASIPVVLELQKKISLMPATVVFSRTTGEKDVFAGLAMIKVDESVLADAISSDDPDVRPSVQFVAKGGRISVKKISRVGKGLFRLSLEWDLGKDAGAVLAPKKFPDQIDYRIDFLSFETKGFVHARFVSN